MGKLAKARALQASRSQRRRIRHSAGGAQHHNVRRICRCRTVALSATRPDVANCGELGACAQLLADAGATLFAANVATEDVVAMLRMRVDMPRA